LGAEREWVKGSGWAVEFLEFGFDDFRNSGDIKFIMGSTGESRSIEDSTGDFGLETGSFGWWLT
jgi:hypothetical protein